ncbi:MAG: hypothetical protein Q9168_007296 [Polycauliona sp. 1 TL-2023]
MAFSRTIVSLLFIAILVGQSSSAPATRSKNVDIQSHLQVGNYTLGEDPRFSIRSLPRENVPVDATSMLVTAVDALLVIGLRDYRAWSPPQQMNFNTPISSRVTISVSPKAPTTIILNGLATLCIYRGIANLVAVEQFVEADFQCFWESVNVADVSIRRKAPPQTNTQAASSNMSSIDTLTAGRLRTHLTYMPGARPINRFDAFITAMQAIKQFSLQGSDAIMTGTILVDAGPQWDASIVFPEGPQQRPIRRQPPYLEYCYAIVSMRSALIYMLEHQRYAELGFVFWVDGIHLGNALMLKGKLSSDAVNTLGASTATA